jgi:cation-transporting ATPase V
MAPTDTLADADTALKVVSDAAGRMRVHATGFRFDEVRAVAIEDSVAKVTGVCAVYAYPRTASVVIFFSPGSRDTDSVLSAIADASQIPAELVPARAPHSAGARKTIAARKFSGGIRRLFGRTPDGDESTGSAGCGGGCESGPPSSCQASPGEDSRRQQRKWLQRVLLAVPLSLLSFGLTTFLAAYPWAKWLAFAATIPVQFVSGWPVLKGAVQQARARSANMDTLIALGTMTAFTYSVYQLFTGGPVYFDTAALISASVVLGRYLEAKAQGKASEAIS